MRAKVSEEDKAITILRAKVKVKEYPDYREDIKPLRIDYRSSGKLNRSTFHF